MSWKRLMDANDTGTQTADLIRVYGEEGARYPRLHIAFYEGRESLWIGFMWRQSVGSHWTTTNLPNELVDELQDMLGVWKEWHE